MIKTIAPSDKTTTREPTEIDDRACTVAYTLGTDVPPMFTVARGDDQAVTMPVVMCMPASPAFATALRTAATAEDEGALMLHPPLESSLSSRHRPAAG